MPLEERLPVDDLYLGMVLIDPLLIMLQFWGGDLVMPDGETMEISMEQRMFFCDQSDRVLLCSGRKIGKTLSLERDFIQTGITHVKTGTLDEGLFFTPANAHMAPVRDRIFSAIIREPLFMEMIARTPRGNPSMSKGDGYVEFTTGWKWHIRIEGLSGTDTNMVGLRCRMIIGDEMAFGNEACHKSRINTALPGCKWKYCGVPNGVRGTPFWRLDQTNEGVMWSRHKYPQFANPLYAPESEREKLKIDHGGEHSQTYVTQVLGLWGDEVVSSFPPGTIATYDDRSYHSFDWGPTSGMNSHFTTGTLDSLRSHLQYTKSRCVIGWDYGVSPDPTAIALFFEEEPGVWYVRSMIILRQVTFPHQIRIVNEIADRFNVVMAVTDEAAAVQQLASGQGWELYSEEEGSGNVMWANVSGRMELVDSTGEPIYDEAGNVVKEYRKKWATDELRNAMIHALEGLLYPYHVWLPAKDYVLTDELAGTTEQRRESGHTRYLTAKTTPGSKSPDDHRTDALRYGVIGIYHLLGLRRNVSRRPPPSEYRKVMGWVRRGQGRSDWRPPWHSTTF